MTSIELAKRQEKSLPLKVFQVTEDQLFVENSTGKVCYKVTLNGRGNSCTCADFATNRKTDPDFLCKHLLAAMNSQGDFQKIGPGVDTGEPYQQPYKALGVYQAISAVQKSLAKAGIEKLQKNTFDNYPFRGIDDVYNALAPILAEHKLCILPRMISRTCEERRSQNGGAMFYVTVDAEFDFVAASDGSKHTVKMFGEGFDRSDKATNKAMSAAYKYACFQTFCIPIEGTAEDNDSDFSSPEVKAKSEPVSEKASMKTPEPVKEKETKAKTPPKKASKPKADATAGAETSKDNPTTMSPAQQTAIQNLARRRGIKDNDLEQMCQDQYGVSLNELASGDASAFIRHLQKSA